MVKIEELKRINMLANVPDHVLKMICEPAQLNIYSRDTLLFSKGENIEIFYNKVNPFKRIFPFYLMFGFLLLLGSLGAISLRRWSIWHNRDAAFSYHGGQRRHQAIAAVSSCGRFLYRKMGD